jgi:hypothetical protein
VSFTPPISGEDLVNASSFCVLRPGRPEEIGTVMQPRFWMVE